MGSRRQKLLFWTLLTTIFLSVFLSGCEAPAAEEIPLTEGVTSVEELLTAEEISAAHQDIGTKYERSSMPPYTSIEELPPFLRQRVEELHAARERDFTPLASIVDDFSVTELTLPEAVAHLSNNYNTLCGIEVLPWPAGPESLSPAALKRISLSLQNRTPRQILDKLVSMDPSFTWFKDQGVANLVIREAYESRDYPLNKPIPQFHVENRPYTMIFGGPYPPTVFGLPQVRESLVFGSSGRWPRELEPRVSVDAVDATVRQIINQVAREVGMSWSAVLCELANGEPIVWFHMHPRIRPPRCSNSQ